MREGLDLDTSHDRTSLVHSLPAARAERGSVFIFFSLKLLYLVEDGRTNIF